jgi:hypothetical protein
MNKSEALTLVIPMAQFLDRVLVAALGIALGWQIRNNKEQR